MNSKIIYSIALPQYFDRVSRLDIDVNTAINDVYDIMIDVDANDSVKGVISQSGVAPFVSKDGGIKATQHITEKDGMRIIGANKNFDEDAFIEGFGEDSPNSLKDNVENSQLESVENIGENGIINSGAISGARNPNGKIKLDDIEIYRSIGAKSKNYDIMDLTTGEMFNFVEGTKIQNVEVFAGKGTNTIYRNANKYSEKYGGNVEDWQHVKGIGWLETFDGEIKAEVHWSQCEDIGKFDFL